MATDAKTSRRNLRVSPADDVLFQQRVVGYHALTAASVTHEEATPRAAKACHDIPSPPRSSHAWPSTRAYDEQLANKDPNPPNPPLSTKPGELHEARRADDGARR